MVGLFSPRELLYLPGYVITVSVSAAAISLVVGSASKWRRPRTATIIGGVLIPGAMLVLALYILFFTPDAPLPSPNDAKAMGAIGLFMLAAITYPFTLATSFLVVRRKTRHLQCS